MPDLYLTPEISLVPAVVKIPEFEFLPTEADFQGVGVGASHVAGHGPAFHISMHHPGQPVFVATLPVNNLAQLVDTMNSLIAAIHRGDFDQPMSAN